MRALNWGVNRRFFIAGRLGTTAAGVGVVSVSMPVTIGHRYTVNKMGLPVAYDSADVAIMSQTGQPLTAVNERLLKRVFNNGQFDQGGRLFGGFWQNMKKEARLDQILIDGMDIVELDYSQAAVMIMYGLVGVNPSFEDAYLLPGLEHNREGVKKVLNAMTQSPKPLQRFPAGTRSMFTGC